MKFKIREIKSRDIPQIYKLFSEFGDYFVEIDNLNLEIKSKGYGEFFYNAMVKDIDRKGIIYVAEVEDSVVGFIGGNYKDTNFSNAPDVLPHRKGRILEFFVSEKYRGNGVGKELFQKMENYLKEKSCNTISMEVFAPNKLARKFYENRGYLERNLDLIKVVRKPSNPRKTIGKVLNAIKALLGS